MGSLVGDNREEAKSENTYELEIVKPTENDDSPGLRFFGIIDTNPITQITLKETVPRSSQYDAWGLDDVRYGSISVTPVPEPSTIILLGSGLLGLIGYGRKKLFKK